MLVLQLDFLIILSEKFEKLYSYELSEIDKIISLPIPKHTLPLPYNYLSQRERMQTIKKLLVLGKIWHQVPHNVSSRILCYIMKSFTSYLTHIWPMFHFITPENARKPKVLINNLHWLGTWHWLASCARISKVPGSSPAASYVQRWALCVHHVADV